MNAWQEWEKGKLIGGRYHVHSTLGCGSIAITYLALDDKANEKVVLKTIKPELLNQLTVSELKDLKLKFLQEAVNLSRCKHSNIVKFLDIFHDKTTDLIYIIMEYIDGRTLESYRKVWSQKEALKYIKQIGDALTYLHDQGIIHRNVKPSNIMLQNGPLGKVVLIGFSVAQSFNHNLTNLKSDNADSFTPKELFWQEDEKGPFTDVYSLSATLYFLLTNELPLSAQDRNLSLFRPDNRNPRELREPKEIVDTISKSVNRAIIKGMAIEAKDRYPSIEILLESLGIRHYLPKKFTEQLNRASAKLDKMNMVITIIGIIVGIGGMIFGVLGASNPNCPPYVQEREANHQLNP
ncbi:serine/threonine protein kinase [Oscillatoria acuminata]|uniref:Serine/threonine protein kinase n=1 Tax=Oscillatoria acuminata PCC 6304 TaxID=56110 RepID=K9TP91_9CYAN|nr:serine/threonine-protein kinase [Oscillatoria acuminata]AFY84682.1 serine/threonine protein kinase [Oscillatoria acuminata PCC 6304]